MVRGGNMGRLLSSTESFWACMMFLTIDMITKIIYKQWTQDQVLSKIPEYFIKIINKDIIELMLPLRSEFLAFVMWMIGIIEVG